MKIYKHGIFFLILAILFWCGYGFFSYNHNPHIISYELENVIKADFLEPIVDNETPIYELKYEKEFGDQTLIMTTGKSEVIKEIKLLEGINVNKNIPEGIVLGDEVAGNFYNHLDIIGEEYQLLDNTYYVVGIKKDSNEIIIPYNEALLSHEWFKKELSVYVNKIELIPAKIEYIRTQVHLQGGQIRSFVVNYEYALFFKNIALLLILVWLVMYFRYWFKRIVTNGRDIVFAYKESIHRKTWMTLIKENKKKLLKFAGIAAVLSAVLIIMIILGLKIEVPKRLIANNVLSVQSWYDLGAYYFEQLTVSFKYGFIEIRRDFIISFMLSMFMVIRLTHTYSLSLKAVKNEI